MEKPLALQTALYLSCKNQSAVDHMDLCLYKAGKIDQTLCNLFMGLVAEEILPSWVLQFAPVDKLKAGRGKGETPKVNRAWMCRDVVLLLPKLEGDLVTAKLAIARQFSGGKVNVFDVDTEEMHTIITPSILDIGAYFDFSFVLP